MISTALLLSQPWHQQPAARAKHSLAQLRQVGGTHLCHSCHTGQGTSSWVRSKENKMFSQQAETANSGILWPRVSQRRELLHHLQCHLLISLCKQCKEGKHWKFYTRNTPTAVTSF